MLKETFGNWREDQCMRLSAALAYYSIFSIAPLLIIAISMAGLFLGADAARGRIETQLKSYVGEPTAKAVQSMVQSASKPAASQKAALVGLVTLIVGAGGVFGQLQDALNLIWKVPKKPKSGPGSMVRGRLLSFAMVLLVGGLLLASLFLTTSVAAMSGFVGNYLKLPGFALGAISSLVSFGVVTVLFATIFKVLPDTAVRWRHVWVGAALTALLFELGKIGLGWYLGRESTTSPYGAAGSVVLLLLWVYYSSLILFFGAEFTRIYAGRTDPAVGG